MILMEEKVTRFLKQYGMHYEDISIPDYLSSFQEDMNRGLSHGQGSLAMIPTYIEPGNFIPQGENVIVLDAGGTNLRIALISFEDDYAPKIEKFLKFPMPGSKGPIKKDLFYQILGDHLEDLLPHSHKIGFCFSYPTEIFPNKDGKLIKFSKEVECPELHGEMIGEGLIAHLKSRGMAENKKIIILNDTVATLLAGMVSLPHEIFSDYIGFIFGTGINGCYIESNHQIGKIQVKDETKTQIINTECGSFDGFSRGDVDRFMDQETKDPGFYRLEKMVSGGYFGTLITKVLSLAIEDRIFSGDSSELAEKLGILSTKDVDDYCHNPHDPNNKVYKLLSGRPEEDREIAFHIVDKLLERSALLTACTMAGFILKGGRGLSPLEPVCLTVDGTTFYRFYRFRNRIERYLQQILIGKNLRYYKIVKVEDAPLIGAAIAALTN